MRTLWTLAIACLMATTLAHGAITGVSHVSVPVRNQDAALTWYSNVLGCEMREDERDGDNFRWLTVGVRGQANMSLVLEESTSGPIRPGSIIFTTDAIAADVAALTARGVRFTSPVTRERWGTWAMFEDPDSNPFLLVERASAPARYSLPRLAN